jgi:hypothetical protein
VKSGRLRWAGYVTRMLEIRNTHRILVEKPLGKLNFEDREGDGRIILSWI